MPKVTWDFSKKKHVPAKNVPKSKKEQADAVRNLSRLNMKPMTGEMEKVAGPEYNLFPGSKAGKERRYTANMPQAEEYRIQKAQEKAQELPKEFKCY